MVTRLPCLPGRLPDVSLNRANRADIRFVPVFRGNLTGFLISILKSEGEANEHLDDLIRDSTGSLAWRFHGVPRSRRADPLVARIRGDLSDPAFCDGQTDSVKITTNPFLQRSRIRPEEGNK